MATATNRWIKNDQEHKIKGFAKDRIWLDLALVTGDLSLTLIPLFYFFCHSKRFPVFPVLNSTIYFIV